MIKAKKAVIILFLCSISVFSMSACSYDTPIGTYYFSIDGTIEETLKINLFNKAIFNCADESISYNNDSFYWTRVYRYRDVENTETGEINEVLEDSIIFKSSTYIRTFAISDNFVLTETDYNDNYNCYRVFYKE